MSFGYSSREKEFCPILCNITLEISNAEITCLLGESGSGKTTLLSLIAGVLSPAQGTINRSNASISYLLQDDLLLPFRTVWQNSILAAELREDEATSTAARALNLLTLMRLDAVLEDLPVSLSGGMRRRVALARQLVCASEVLLLDEPFTSQDRVMRVTLEDAIYARCRSEETAALVATHDIDSAVALGDRITILGRTHQLVEQWQRPNEFSALSPAQRRLHPMFGDQIALVSRLFWEITSGQS